MLSIIGKNQLLADRKPIRVSLPYIEGTRTFQSNEESKIRYCLKVLKDGLMALGFLLHLNHAQGKPFPVVLLMVTGVLCVSESVLPDTTRMWFSF